MSRRLAALAITLGLAAPLSAQQAPSSDVWLAPMIVKDGIVTIGDLISVSNRPGYDNQPAFSRDGKRIYYTSQRNGQTDLMRYDIKRKETDNITDSPESEYSAQLIPGGSDLAAIVVERDSTQRLWRIGSDGKRSVLLPALKPVGYHVWANDHQVLAYVLGNESRGQANALVLADIRTNKVDTLARNIGRSLGRNPLTGALTFTERPANADAVQVRTVDPATRTIGASVSGLPGKSDFYAWSPGGRLFMADGTTISQKPPSGPWAPAITIRDPRVGAISRIAISPKGEWIAFVAEEPGSAPLASFPGQTAPSTTEGRNTPPDMVAPPAKKPYTDVAVPGPAKPAVDSLGRPLKPYTDVAVPGPEKPGRPAQPATGDMTAPAQTLTVIVVRHAEKAAGTGDVALSEAGLTRARALASTLANAGVRAVFTSPLARTRQTAEPLATAAGLPLQPISLDGSVDAHAKRVAEAVFKTPGGAVLIVGHSNTVPAILAALGAPRIADLCESQYDNLFVLTIPPTGARALVRATYGAPTPVGEGCAAMK